MAVRLCKCLISPDLADPAGMVSVKIIYNVFGDHLAGAGFLLAPLQQVAYPSYGSASKPYAGTCCDYDLESWSIFYGIMSMFQPRCRKLYDASSSWCSKWKTHQLQLSYYTHLTFCRPMDWSTTACMQFNSDCTVINRSQLFRST